jgi:streptomycin 6-kinase
LGTGLIRRAREQDGSVHELELPQNLAAAARAEHRDDWLVGLGDQVASLASRWSLTLGAPFQPGGATAWVAPAWSVDFGDVVLKVAWRHPEAEREVDGLRAWAGDGSVRVYLFEALDDSLALLLERCSPGTSLAARPEHEQDVVIAGLLPRLWHAPTLGYAFRPLQQMCEAWADTFDRKVSQGLVELEAGLAREGATLFRSLPGTSTRNVLLCTDLHAGNVLAAQREPWLVIDPKPYVGDPTYDALQHMLNCDERLQNDPRGFARRIAELLDVDVERLLLWLFARCVVESADWPGLARIAVEIAPR